MGHTNGLRVMICVAQVPSMTCKKTSPFTNFLCSALQILADPYSLPIRMDQNGHSLPIQCPPHSNRTHSIHTSQWVTKVPPGNPIQIRGFGPAWRVGYRLQWLKSPTTVFGARVSEQHPDTPSMLIAHDIT